MESDYGYEYSRDFEEVGYLAGAGFDSDVEGSEEDVDALMYEEIDLSGIEYGENVAENEQNEFIVNRKRPRSETEITPKKKKKLKKKRQRLLNRESAVEQFYGNILEWNIDLLLKNDRACLDLPPLPSLLTTFPSTTAYFEYHKAISLEEVRAVLTNSLNGNSQNQIHLTCKKAFDVSSGRLTTVSFKISAGSLEYSRPGTVFILECRKLPQQMTLAAVSLFGFSSLNLIDKKSVSLWISSDWLRHRQDVVTKVDVEWIAKPLETVISYQRMCSVCVDMPRPPFMSQLLGNIKPSSHIIFIDCGDDCPDSLPTTKQPDNDSDIIEVTDNDSDIIEVSVIKPKEEPSNNRLNKSQMIALETSLKHLANLDGSIMLIHGPPGCGKTFFLSLLVNEILRKSMRILACAPSNKAICVALEAFLTSDVYSHIPSNAKICLVGVEDKVEFCSTSDARSSISKSRSCALFPESSSRSINVNEAVAPLPLLPDYLTDATERITLPKIAQDLLVYKYSFHLIAASDALSQFISQLTYALTNLNIMRNNRDLYLRTLLIFARECNLVLKKIMTITESLDDFTYRVQCGFDAESTSLTNLVLKCLHGEPFDSIEVFTTLVGDALSELQDVLCDFDRIRQLDKFAEKVAEALIRSSDCIFSTLTGVGHSIMKRNIKSIDVLICDEASQALESEVIIGLNVSPKHLVLIGDHMQLPATTFSSEVQSKGLNMSMMERLLKHSGITCHMLATQYRMHPEISSFPNKHFYQNRLENASHVLTRHYSMYAPSIIGNLPDFLKYYSIIDFSGYERFDRSNSACNPQEANFVASLVNYISSRYHSTFAQGVLSASISIITFYSAQVQEIRQALTRYRIPFVRVMTVDSFQGSECDIVILSFTRSNAKGNIGFLSDARRLNVALTRAKHLLIGVGCVKTLSSSGNSRKDYVQKLVEDASVRGRIFKSADVEKHFR